MKEFSTDDVESKHFRPHGKVEFSILDESLIVYHAVGPFNMELFEALDEVEKGALVELKATIEKWCEIVVFSNSCMASQESLDYFQEYLKRVKRLGVAPIASAFVFEEKVEGSLLMKKKFRNCYSSAGLVFSEFTNQEEAVEWVKSVLAENV